MIFSNLQLSSSKLTFFLKAHIFPQLSYALRKLFASWNRKCPPDNYLMIFFAPNVGHSFDDNSNSTLHCTFQSHINSGQIKVSIFCCCQLAERHSQETDAHEKGHICGLQFLSISNCLCLIFKVSQMSSCKND